MVGRKDKLAIRSMDEMFILKEALRDYINKFSKQPRLEENMKKEMITIQMYQKLEKSLKKELYVPIFLSFLSTVN